MLFNSFEFLFVFLPMTLAGYFIVGWLAPRMRFLWLTAASLAFYGYWDWHFLFVFGPSIVLNYGLASAISTLRRRSPERVAVLITAIMLNLAGIGFYKYGNFAIDTVNRLAHTQLAPLALVLPLGISFFTFTQIAYLVDVYRGAGREANFVKYALFVSYFPHLIAGPILHHSEMMPQFSNEASRRISAERIAVGMTAFLIGLFKKTVIADGFATIADPVFLAAAGSKISTVEAWGGSLAYALQIYFDFSGYSDMAVGLSCLFGIKLPFNFDAPYKSRSIIEFWRRWHITLSRFLRDYLYVPLGGNRKGVARQYVNLLATMLLGGLWHGANWTYVAWGGVHGVCLLVNHAWVKVTRGNQILTLLSRTQWYAVASLLLTQLCVVVAWVFFRAADLKSTRHMLSAMFHVSGKGATPTIDVINSITLAALVVGYAACFCLPNVNALFAGWNLGIETYRNPRRWSLPSLQWTPNVRWAVGSAALMLVSLLAILIAGDGTPFLYSRF